MPLAFFAGRKAALQAPPPYTPQTESFEHHENSDHDQSFRWALDALPANAMFCDKDLILRYMNRSSRATMRSLEQHLPVSADEMIGKSIHIFHKTPANVDRILGHTPTPSHHQLPHKATIALGPVKLDLNVEPMSNDQGEFIGAVVVWGVSTQQTIEALRKAQEGQHSDIEHLNGNLQKIAIATHDLDASITEIARNANDVSVAAEKSREASHGSRKTIDKLRSSSAGVAKVADPIASIATQTGVLALNANIEAARAGVHGKGFAVVANEVRKLAEQTRQATEEIQKKVGIIGDDISGAMNSIEQIVNQTDDLSGLSHQLAAAAEEQHLATQEMAHNLERAAHRTGELARVRLEDHMI